MNALVISPTRPLAAIPMRDRTAELILECVCKAYCMSREMLGSERRHGRLPEARAVATWLLKTRTGMNMSLIGEILNRDPSSMHTAQVLIKRRRFKDSELDKFMDELGKAVDERLAEARIY